MEDLRLKKLADSLMVFTLMALLFPGGVLSSLSHAGSGADSGADSGVSAASGVVPFQQPALRQTEGFQDFFAEVAEGVYVAGQPSEAGLDYLKDRGVTRVINLRTHAEMDNRAIVPFDEASAVAERDMEYVHIPLGGPDTPYSPQALQEFAAAVESADGGVLLHCTVAWRASHLWAAYLVAHHDVSVPQAVAVGKAMNMGGFPFAEFLGRTVTLEGDKTPRSKETEMAVEVEGEAEQR